MRSGSPKVGGRGWGEGVGGRVAGVRNPFRVSSSSLPQHYQLTPEVKFLTPPSPPLSPGEKKILGAADELGADPSIFRILVS